jgi:hypothetical protein
MGVENLILTDISRDGTLEGPNFDMLRELSSAVPCLVTASGGVHSIGDIRRLRDMGLYAAIAGKRLRGDPGSGRGRPRGKTGGKVRCWRKESSPARRDGRTGGQGGQFH